MRRVVIVMSFLFAFILSLEEVALAYKKELKGISTAITENISATAMVNLTRLLEQAWNLR